MVIRPTSNSFKTPGLEYVLTYFDNPGVVLPQTVTSWVAQKQLPDFLHKLYIATLDYAQTHRLEEAHRQQQKRERKTVKPQFGLRGLKLKFTLTELNLRNFS